jgi:cation diffusion facilitator family transporter
LTQISFFVGKKWKSKSLIADGWHHRSDALSSLVIFIGILFSSRFWWIDGALGIAVAVLILIAAWQIVRDSVSPLVGTIPSGPMVEEIAKTCREIGGIDVEAHHFHLHEYGDHREMTFHIKVPGERTVDAAHALADRIELVLRDRMNIEATIHVEPGKATAIPDPSTLS